MFVLQLSSSYFAPVSLRLAGEDGRPKTFTFDAEFRRLTTGEHDALMARARAETMTDTEIARELLVGWRQVRAASGDELAFSPEARDRLLDVNGAGTAICQAYVESVTQAPRGN